MDRTGITDVGYGQEGSKLWHSEYGDGSVGVMVEELWKVWELRMMSESDGSCAHFLRECAKDELHKVKKLEKKSSFL